jgi:rRNA maturation endonuclease Nob1
MEIQTCKNCEKTFDASFEYCPYCGQEATDNLTIGVLFSNTIENYFSIDARFFRSFIPLMIKPGVLPRRFVDGKRLKYLHPAQFYLFISVLFFFLFASSVREADSKVSQALEKGIDSEIVLDSVVMPEQDSVAIEQARKALKENQKITRMSDTDIARIDSVIASEAKAPGSSFSLKKKELDSLIDTNAPLDQKLKALGMEEDAGRFSRKFYQQLLKFYEKKGGGILQTLYDSIPIAMFLLMPLFAILLKIFYWSRGNFAHHMVFSFYYFTFLFTSFCLLMLLNMIWDVPFGLEFLVFMSFLIYLMIAMRNFYRSSWIGAFFKSGFISFIYMIVIVPIAFVGLVFASFMLY